MVLGRSAVSTVLTCRDMYCASRVPCDMRDNSKNYSIFDDNVHIHTCKMSATKKLKLVN